MQYRGSEIVREVAWVVFDEIHYMRDKERGYVWEETIILLQVLLFQPLSSVKNDTIACLKLRFYKEFNVTLLYIIPSSNNTEHLK